MYTKGDMSKLPLLLFVLVSILAKGQSYFLYIGTYTHTGSKGIYIYKFDAGKGTLDSLGCQEGLINPSFITLSSDEKFLYACTETKTLVPGNISAFAIDSKGSLRFINKQSSGGANPAYASTTKNNASLFAANYTAGSVSLLGIKKDGSLETLKQLIAYTGKSLHPQRQDKPHVHAAIFSADERYALATDLGTDQIVSYPFSSKTNTLDTAKAIYTKTVAGSGPRHLVFHPTGNILYSTEELSGTISVYRFREGKLDSLQRISSHSDTTKGPFGCADIHISPDGSFLYASNRGNENNIAIFSVDKTKGTLKSVGYQPTLGTSPRNFVIEPTGKYILVGNQETATVVVLKRDAVSGLLAPTGIQIHIPQPTCLRMVRAK